MKCPIHNCEMKPLNIESSFDNNELIAFDQVNNGRRFVKTTLEVNERSLFRYSCVFGCNFEGVVEKKDCKFSGMYGTKEIGI
jgi:hypothetical protein